MYTAETETEDGLPVLRFYEYERIRQVPYQIDFWLEEDGRFLNCRMRIVNESSEVIPMYWWSNMAVPEYENGRVVVPAEQAFTGRKGMIVKVDIPMVDGVEVTDYKKIPNSVDYFFAIPGGKAEIHRKPGSGRLRSSSDLHETSPGQKALLLGQTSGL